MPDAPPPADPEQPRRPAGEQDELLDVLDAAGNVVGAQWRSSVEDAGGSDYRVVNAFLQRGDGRVWLPIRAMSASRWPGALDASVAGHVRHGETAEQTLLRELGEETGLNAADVAVTPLGRLAPPIVGVHMDVFHLRLLTAARPVLNPAEHSDGLWVRPQYLARRLRDGQPAKDDLKYILHACWEHLTHAH